MQTATFIGKDFRTLLSEATRFPSVGTYSGSELVTLTVGGGLCVARTMGLAQCWAEVPAEGKLECSIDERVIVSFMSLCTESSKVRLTNTGSELILKTRTREVKEAPGAIIHKTKKPATAGDPLSISKSLGDTLRYLSDVAFDSESRQELCCVMLAYSSPATDMADGIAYALACNQKIVACMRVGRIHQPSIRTAVPLLLAKNVVSGDSLYLGAKDSVLSSGVSLYSVPSPARAQRDFPLETIFGYGTLARSVSAMCSGDKLGLAVGECNTILAAKTDVRLRLAVTEEGILLRAKSGTTEFKTQVPITKYTAAMDFDAPLDALRPVLPLLTGKNVALSAGPHGELFLSMKSSWVMFPAYVRKK